MSDMLRIGASGISAYRTALSVIGENVANAETKGYARRDVALGEVTTAGSSPFTRSALTGGGVAATGVNRAWNDFKAADARGAASDAGAGATRTKWLGAIETALPDGDSGISARLTDFFSAANKLAADPASSVARTTTLSALDDAADAIVAGANGLAKVAGGIATEAATSVSALNDDLASLARINQSIARAAEGSSAKASLADERDRLLDSVAGSIAIDTEVAANGSVRVTLAGAPQSGLVDGNQAASIDLALAADGRLSFSTSGAAIAPSGGSLAGLSDAASAVATTRGTLDGLAVDFSAQLNAWQAQGRTPAGAAGAPLLAIAGGAATLALATTSPAAIAAASADGVANGNLATLADLRGADGAEARMSALVTLNAQALSSANARSTAAATRRDSAYADLADGAGIDLDREAAELIRFQQAYDGSARVIQVARETMQAILQLF